MCQSGILNFTSSCLQGGKVSQIWIWSHVQSSEVSKWTIGSQSHLLILRACPYQQFVSSKRTETTNGTAPICWFWRHAHINKLCRRTGQKQQMARHPFVDLPDGSTIQIVDSAPILTFLVIPKQQSGSRVLYGNWCKWRHLVTKFWTNASGAIWWPNWELIQVAPSGDNSSSATEINLELF